MRKRALDAYLQENPDTDLAVSAEQFADAPERTTPAAAESAGVVEREEERRDAKGFIGIDG